MLEKLYCMYSCTSLRILDPFLFNQWWLVIELNPNPSTSGVPEKSSMILSSLILKLFFLLLENENINPRFTLTNWLYPSSTAFWLNQFPVLVGRSQVQKPESYLSLALLSPALLGFTCRQECSCRASCWGKDSSLWRGPGSHLRSQNCSHSSLCTHSVFTVLCCSTVVTIYFFPSIA